MADVRSSGQSSPWQSDLTLDTSFASQDSDGQACPRTQSLRHSGDVGSCQTPDPASCLLVRRLVERQHHYLLTAQLLKVALLYAHNPPVAARLACR